MRERFDLDLHTLERATFLIHGNYGVGKTYLLGDMLRHEAALGKTVRFLNVKGEDGYLSIANLGLGSVGESVDTIDDFKTVLKEWQAEKIGAMAFDGMKHLGKLVIKSVCGDKLPEVGNRSTDWQQIHKMFEGVVESFRWVAPIVLCASASDRSMDQVSGELSLTPDLPGRQAASSGGMFDFVFVLKAASMGPGRIKRTLLTAPLANTIIRARLPRSLPTEIELPDGLGGWAKLWKAIQDVLDRQTKEATK